MKTLELKKRVVVLRPQQSAQVKGGNDSQDAKSIIGIEDVDII